MQIERERAVKWAKMTSQWRKYSDSDKLFRRVNKGIPNSVRGSVWRYVMNIEGVKEAGVYMVRGGRGREGRRERGVKEAGVYMVREGRGREGRRERGGGGKEREGGGYT